MVTDGEAPNHRERPVSRLAMACEIPGMMR